MSSDEETPSAMEKLMKPITHTSTHSSDSDDLSDSLNDIDAPSISHLYTDANLYERVLCNTGCIYSRSSDADGANGFHDLVGKDLDSSEQAIVGRLAKLTVTGDTWVTGDLTAEPESYEAEDKENEISFDDSVDDIESKGPVLHRAATSDGDSWKLEPDEIISLLIQEFGPVAEEGEEEKLILETDGCLVHDVIIVGVIHLTTHRLTFHASLLATRPDLLPAEQVIKSGPATVHRKGWRAKRRVWMELSHDILCSYTSSNDKDRIRPLRTVLLSGIQSVLPIDPKKPRYIRVKFTHAPKGVEGIIEFDTEESARDWRRELTGALYIYRHRRREALDGSTGDTDSGVRLSCALDQITQADLEGCPNFPHIASLRVQAPQLDQGEPGAKESQVFRIGPIQPFHAWTQLRVHVAAAKARRRLRPSTSESGVFIDFGELSLEADNQGSVQRSDNQGRKEKTIRSALALGAEPELWIARARLFRCITCTGYFVVSPHYVSFWSKSFTNDDIRYRLAASIIRLPKPFRTKLGYGLALELEALPDLRFEFRSADIRDGAIKRINYVIETGHATSRLPSSGSSTPTLVTSASLASPTRSASGIFAPVSRSLAAAIAIAVPDSVQLKMPKAINLPREILVSRPSLHFVCLTIGSRGDVQPYIALGLGLKKEGHRVTIVTHDEYKTWIEGFGIGHRQAGGDPGALMKLSVENKMFSPDFFRESLTNFRPWLDQLLLDSWESCKDADVLLESPSAMAGVHIAEALNIPYFRTFTMPWTKTAEFPHAFLSPPVEAPTFNSASYVLFSNVMWTATSGQINKWRRHTLNIGNTDMGHLAQSKITFIYNFSHAVVPKPLDWGDTTIISGYWFLDNPDLGWTPPADLIEWMAKARKDGKPIVYIGFGSITVPHPNRVTSRIIKAVLKSDVRAIISKGWSARMTKASDKDPVPEIPPQCYQLDKVPHDWLFPQIDAALHHGGAGTTGASLRAGIPTLIKPWFGDQWFWASRVEKLGAGLKVPGLRSHDIAAALTKATSSRIMKEKAAAVGERIRSEDGVHRAIHTIYTYLPRAAQNRAYLDKN